MQRREGGLKDFNCIAQNTSLFVDLLKNIFSASISKLKRVEPQKLMKNYQITILFLSYFILRNECFFLRQFEAKKKLSKKKKNFG